MSAPINSFYTFPVLAGLLLATTCNCWRRYAGIRYGIHTMCTNLGVVAAPLPPLAATANYLQLLATTWDGMQEMLKTLTNSTYSATTGGWLLGPPTGGLATTLSSCRIRGNRKGFEHFLHTVPSSCKWLQVVCSGPLGLIPRSPFPLRFPLFSPNHP